MNDNIAKLKKLVADSSSIVFFGGAGASTESGIPDFRSQDGLYNTKYDYPPEVMLSHSFFVSRPNEFFRFYRDKMIYLNAKPNLAHIGLAKLEQQGKLKAVITQNIDGLHQAAGSKNVVELHGSIHRNYCMECSKLYSLDFILRSEEIPSCTCGGIVKPDVVLYEESLDEAALDDSIQHISDADMLIIGGTSMSVYPAAGLVQFYKGDRLVVINKSETHVDWEADLVLRDGIGMVLGAVVAL